MLRFKEFYSLTKINKQSKQKERKAQLFTIQINTLSNKIKRTNNAKKRDVLIGVQNKTLGYLLGMQSGINIRD